MVESRKKGSPIEIVSSLNISHIGKSVLAGFQPAPGVTGDSHIKLSINIRTTEEQIKTM
ncbi:MAG: hypothetical protein ACYCXK_08565 [Candidatus Humimicrobiaceae bacterium]